MRSLPLFAVIALAGCTQSPDAYPSLLPVMRAFNPSLAND